MRVKNEILVQMDGVSNADANERLLLVGATNRPQELDEAARRRLQKRLLIPLPDVDALPLQRTLACAAIVSRAPAGTQRDASSSLSLFSARPRGGAALAAQDTPRTVWRGQGLQRRPLHRPA